MTLLFSVITAAYGKGTHHRLALDGVNRLTGPNAEAWQRLFFKHAEVLVTGSKAPDDQFKDFQNHVLHPRDNFWGGAPDKARSWYVDLVETLAKGDWPAAVWCAGVLSHYVTDPINPFHTAQSEAENAIHRAFEWSISTSYADLKKLTDADAPRTINVTDGPDWLERLLCQAASDANQHYEKLIAHYDIHRGVVDPPSGLDSIAQKIIGDLIGQASAVFATVLERAIMESKASPPDVSLTLDMILATLKIPVTKLLKKLANAEERRLVERMYDELKATGTVEVNLPEDDRMVRDLHAKDVLGKQAKPNLDNRFPEKGRRKTAETEGERKERLKRIGPRSIPAPGAAHGAKPAAAAATRGEQELPVDEPARPAPRAADQAKPAGPVGRFRGEPVPEAPRAAAIVTEPKAAPAPEASAAKTEASPSKPKAEQSEPNAPLQPAALLSTTQPRAALAPETASVPVATEKARAPAQVKPAAVAAVPSVPITTPQTPSALPAPPAPSAARPTVEPKPAAVAPSASPVQSQRPPQAPQPAERATTTPAASLPQSPPSRPMSTSVPLIAAKPAMAATPAAAPQRAAPDTKDAPSPSTVAPETTVSKSPPPAANTAPVAPRPQPASAETAAVGSPQAIEPAQPTRLLRRLNQLPQMRPAGRQHGAPQSAQASVQPLQPRPAAAEQTGAGPPRFHLTPAQPIVDAPSIGPKMAERLVPLGIVTVGDLLNASAGKLAAKLAMSIIDADIIADWQDQARLVCTVPGLRGTHAQLLVGAGFRSAEAIADAEPAQLCARVLTFATAKDGQRILRNGEPPDIERIKSWVDSARAVRAA